MYKALASDSPSVRAAVVGTIAKIAQENPEEGAFDILINALTDPEEIVRCEAAAALGNLAYQPAIPNLIELLHHPDWESRKSAALALMKIGEVCDTDYVLRTTIEPLQAALTQEPEAAVQVVLKLAISQIERISEEETW